MKTVTRNGDEYKVVEVSGNKKNWEERILIVPFEDGAICVCEDGADDFENNSFFIPCFWKYMREIEEPAYRPYKAEEIPMNMEVVNKETGTRFSITGISHDAVLLENLWHTFDWLLAFYTHPDSSPCGVAELMFPILQKNKEVDIEQN